MFGEKRDFCGFDQKSEKLELNLDAIAEHSSIRERAAAEAERATVDLKKAEYMAGHIGEEFDGVISGVTAFGMFIELENGVEGLVHISSLMDDYYEFYEDRYALLGSHTRKVYRLGDPVRIEVLQVNIADRNIDFIMAGENDAVRDRIKAQLLGQRSHASARSAIKKSGGKAVSLQTVHISLLCQLGFFQLFQAISKRISLGGQFFLFCFAAFLFSDLLPKLFQRRITHMECPFPALRFFVQKLVQKMLPIIYKCFGDNVAVRIFILTRMNRAIVEAKNFSIRHSEENG